MKRSLALLTISCAVCSGLVTTAGSPAQPTPAPASQTPGAPAPGRGGRGGPAVVSPQIEADGRVTFRVLAPNATAVTVGGDINGSLVPDPAAAPPQPPAPGAQGGRGGGTIETRETPGGHTWENWRLYLAEVAPKLFR